MGTELPRSAVVPVRQASGDYGKGTRLACTIAHCVGRFLERQELVARDAETAYLTADSVDDDSVNTLFGHSLTYRSRGESHSM